MGACGASAPALVVLSARWVPLRLVQGDWGLLGGLWGWNPLWSITFWAQMEVFMELSELSGFGTFNATTPSLSRVFMKVVFPPVCFRIAGTVGLTD